METFNMEMEKQNMMQGYLLFLLFKKKNFLIFVLN